MDDPRALPDAVAAPLREALTLHAGTPAPGALFAEDAYRGLRVIASPAAPTRVEPLLARALEAAAWPDHTRPIPRSETLTPVQRALAEAVASWTDLPLHRFAIPQCAWARRRWLGLDAPGPLEREVAVLVAGATTREPLWRALRLLDDAGDRPQAAALLAALPLGERVAVLVDLELGAYRVQAPEPQDFAAIDGDDGAWAPALADRVVALYAPGAPLGERGGRVEPGWAVRWWVFLGLVRAHESRGLELDPRWDVLLPAGWGAMGALGRRCLAALPAVRRGPALAAALARKFPRDAIACALEQLPWVLAPELVALVFARAAEAVGDLGATPRRETLRALREVVASHPALTHRVDEHAAALPALPCLHLSATITPTELRELTALQRAQLASSTGVGNAGLPSSLATEDEPEGWDPDVPPPAEGALAYVSIDTIVDGDGRPAYETSLFMREDGVVFHAGTTEPAAYVCQGVLDAPDPALVEALHEALRRRA